MVDLSDIPILGRIAVAGAGVADVLLHSGAYLVEVLSLIVATLLGRPELIAGMLSTLNRLADRIPFLPADVIDKMLTIALVAMFVLYVIRFVESTQSNS